MRADSIAAHAGLIFGVIPRELVSEYGPPDKFFESERAPQFRPTGSIMSLDKYMQGTAIAVNFDPDGVLKFNRESVLKYVANRRGGVHFDGRRGPDLHLSQNRSAKGSKADRDSFYLDHDFVRVGHLNGAEFEVVAMAQVISRPAWAGQLIELAAELAPEDFNGDPQELKFWQPGGEGWATTRFEAGPPAPDDPARDS